MHSLTDISGGPIASGAATFVSLLLPVRVVREVGLPISAFFIWADDLEYTRRISRKYLCYVVPESVVEHRCPTNNGGNISTDTEDRIDRYRYAYRTEVYLYRREGLRGVAHLLDTVSDAERHRFPPGDRIHWKAERKGIAHV